MNKIELKNITVRYGKNTVLNNFDLTVEEGQILGIVGPSGCGKTTVVRAICIRAAQASCVNPSASNSRTASYSSTVIRMLSLAVMSSGEKLR